MEIYDNDEGDDDSDGGIEVDDEIDEETLISQFLVVPEIV